MTEQTQTPALVPVVGGANYARAAHAGAWLVGSVTVFTGLCAWLMPAGWTLALIGDSLAAGLALTAAIFAFRNASRSQGQEREFWLLIMVGSILWFFSLLLWSIYEVGYRRPVPDDGIIDILLFVKLVPFTAAVALQPHKVHDRRFRGFGFLDVSILMLYAMYLFMFYAFSYRLLPGRLSVYNYRFNLVDLGGNLLFVVCTGAAYLSAKGTWRNLYRLYFLAASTYCIASNASNTAMDAGHYYSGGMYDVPLVAAMAGFVSLGIIGGGWLKDRRIAVAAAEVSGEAPDKRLFLPSYLAMMATISMPVIGYWLLTSGAHSKLFGFRLAITLVTILLMTLLISVKQDLLTGNLIGSLKRLTETYGRIDQFKSHLVQSEKLTALGALVAKVANEIRGAMAATRGEALKVTERGETATRVQAMAGKIGQYAQRTDALVENMLLFAQETPLELASVEIKPVVESALQLSRIGKHANVRVEVRQEEACPNVRGDSSQLLHVFLEIVANAGYVLEEAGGGSLEISIAASNGHVQVEFADSGPGIKEPQHLFEPFYTTKPVGKGTGLGLSTCYGIIQQHAGEISYRNRPEGGALFLISLPVFETRTVARGEVLAIPGEGTR